MADPLSITAGIVAVLQATNKVLEICYNFKAALRNGPWGLSQTIEEVRDLRAVLEQLDALADIPYSDDESALGKIWSNLSLLCKAQNSPLETCTQELRCLEKKVVASWSSKAGLKQRALKRAFSWSLREDEIKQSLQRIERCKATLSLAITADEVCVERAIQFED